MTRPTALLPRALPTVHDGIAHGDARPHAPARPLQASELHERPHGAGTGPGPAIRRPERGAECATGTGDPTQAPRNWPIRADALVHDRNRRSPDRSAEW